MSVIITGLRVFKRHVSSQSARRSSPGSLPPAKMRALVSLYHEAENFVTPENLSQKIDDAFLTSDEALATGDVAGGHMYETIQDLRNRERDRRQVPRIGDYTPVYEGTTAHTDGWSSAEHERVKAVAEALYGTVKRFKPGLEILEESAHLVQRELLDD
jgi:hypothetical protein